MFDVVSALAWRQHGAFSAAQAVASGVHRSWLSRWWAAGSLRRRAPGVYVLAAAPATARQTLMVHLLAAGEGARATADSALGLWCPELVLPLRPVIAVPRQCGYRTRAAVVRRSRDLHLDTPGAVDGIPTVGVARALLDASVRRTPDQVLETHARPGRPGIRVYREALLGLRREVTDSEFERLVVRDLVAAGLPEPRLHHVVRLPGEAPIELDLDWPGVRLDIELDGSDHAERVRRARRDRQRDRLLQAAGYVVARYTWRDYVAERRAMLAEIAGFLDLARRDGRPALGA